MSNATATFLNQATDNGSMQLTYDDTHGFWGGQAVTVFGDGKAVVKVVDRTQQETFFQHNIGAGQAQSIIEICVQNDLLNIQPASRSPVPDESCIRLMLCNGVGEPRVVVRWGNDPPEPRFQHICKPLLDLSKEVRAVQPASEAPVPNLPAMPPTPTPSYTPDRVLAALRDFFTRDDWHFEMNPNRPVIRLPFQGRNGNWQCFAQARTTNTNEQALFYTVAPVKAPEHKRLAVAEFITRANYGMSLGNFELDFSDGEIRYKTSMEITDCELTDALLKPLVYTNVLMLDKYLPGLMEVIYGNVEPVEAVRKIEE